jgi:hypothetical protein
MLHRHFLLVCRDTISEWCSAHREFSLAVKERAAPGGLFAAAVDNARNFWVRL